MRERERTLLEDNERLRAENYTLKYNLRTMEAANHQNRTGWVAQLQQQVAALQAENNNLRRSMASAASVSEDRHKREMRELRYKYTEKKNENEVLVVRIRDLKRKIHEVSRSTQDNVDGSVSRLMDDIRAWKRRHDDVERRAGRLRENLDTYITDNDQLLAENEALARENATCRRMMARRGLL